MGTITDKLTYLNETKTKIKDNLNFGGANITNETFREYANKIKDLYVYFMNNGLEVVWNNWEKVIGSGTTITLNQTMEAPIKIDLKGNTSQNGTPTPTAPIEVETTTGGQEIMISGKNILKFDNANNPSRSLYTYTTEREDLIVCTKNTTGNDFYAQFITYLESGKTYTLSVDDDTNRNIYMYSDRLWGTAISGLTNKNAKKGTPFTFTSSYTGKAVIGFFGGGSQTLTKPMLEIGNTATTYEEYKGNDYEINLGKNLVKSARVDSATSIYNVTLFVEADLEPSTTYTFSFNGTNGNRIYANEKLFTTGPYIDITNDRVVITLTTKDTISKSDTGQYNSSYQKWVIFKNGKNEDSANVYDNLMLEKGNVATSYSPYKTPIYLGEIRNTNNVIVGQDYIFRNTTENPLYDSNLEEGQWYIHKEIGKVVLNGSESWNAYDSTYKRLNLLLSGVSTISARTMCYSNYFKYSSSSNDVGTCFTNGGRIYLYPTLDINTTALFQTWLSTHNTDVYYILDTPTNTLIEDYELIYQLNELEKAKSYDNTTNILQSNDNLPFILDVRALKKL